MRKDKWKFYKTFAYVNGRNKQIYQTTCGMCGHVNDPSHLVTCEECGTNFEEFLKVRKRKHNVKGLVNLLRVEKGKQVYELYQTYLNSEKGNPCEISKSIVLRMVFDGNNLESYERKTFSFCMTTWNKCFALSSKMKKKNFKFKKLYDDLEKVDFCFNYYTWEYNEIFVINKLTPTFKYACLDSKCLQYVYKYKYLLTYTYMPQIEYLVKSNKIDWLKFITENFRDLKDNKEALNFIKYQCKKPINELFENKGYLYSNSSTLLDTIRMIKDFGSRFCIAMDNLYYTNNINKLHDKLTRCKDIIDAEKYEEEYKKKLDKYNYNQIENDNFIIKILGSVKEFAIEGSKLHHCVYKAKYYTKDDCVILSARLKNDLDTPIETIEYRPSEKKVIQIRGDHDNESIYHNEIVNLSKKIKYNLHVQKSYSI